MCVYAIYSSLFPLRPTACYFLNLLPVFLYPYLLVLALFLLSLSSPSLSWSDAFAAKRFYHQFSARQKINWIFAQYLPGMCNQKFHRMHFGENSACIWLCMRLKLMWNRSTCGCWMLTIQASTCFTADSPVMLSLPPWYYCNLCAFSSGTSQGVEAVVRARVGGTAELGCSLTPLSTGVTTPNLFPLHVVEWVRLGYNVPILIKFGVYAPRVHPNYKGESSCPRSMS